MEKALAPVYRDASGELDAWMGDQGTSPKSYARWISDHCPLMTLEHVVDRMGEGRTCVLDDSGKWKLWEIITDRKIGSNQENWCRQMGQAPDPLERKTDFGWRFGKNTEATHRKEASSKGSGGGSLCESQKIGGGSSQCRQTALSVCVDQQGVPFVGSSGSTVAPSACQGCS